MYIQEMRLYPRKVDFSAGNRFYFSHHHLINIYCSFSHNLESLMNFDKIQCLNFAYDIHITSDPEILEGGGNMVIFSTPQNH